jgi:hypothetical protein
MAWLRNNAFTLFRVAFFGGLALHFFPALLHLDDHYAPGALRSEEWNHWLYIHFTRFPRAVIVAAAWLTMLAIAGGLAGIVPRITALVSFAGCYCFASFNGLPVQTLALINAWALLILFVICGTGPLFRSLALYQTLLVVFFSGVEKLLAGWPLSNEMAIIFSYPRGFLVRDWVTAIHWPSWITALFSWGTVLIELGTPIGLLFARTRMGALIGYQLFFLGIFASLEVPPLFYFMFAGAGLLSVSKST